MHPIHKASAVLSYVFLTAVFALVAYELSHRVDSESSARNRAVIEQLRLSCNRSQLRNGYSQARAETPLERRMVAAYFRIIDCHATYRPGTEPARTRYVLPERLQRCFVTLTRDLYWRSHPVTTDSRRLARICPSH